MNNNKLKQVAGITAFAAANLLGLGSDGASAQDSEPTTTMIEPGSAQLGVSPEDTTSTTEAPPSTEPDAGEPTTTTVLPEQPAPTYVTVPPTIEPGRNLVTPPPTIIETGAPAQLPKTGSEAESLAIAGGALVAAGVVLVAAQKRLQQ